MHLEIERSSPEFLYLYASFIKNIKFPLRRESPWLTPVCEEPRSEGFPVSTGTPFVTCAYLCPVPVWSKVRAEMVNTQTLKVV